MKKRMIYPLCACSFLLLLTACEASPTTEGRAMPSLENGAPKTDVATINQTSPEQVLAFTQQSWPEFAARLRPAIIGRFGFKDKDDLLQSAIGTPWPMLALADAGPVAVTDQHIWRVPLIKNGEMRLLITVEEQNGELKIVSLGATELARELQQTLPRAEKVFSEKSFYILRCYSLNEDYIGAMGPALPTPNERVIPLRTAANTLHKNALPQTIAISSLKEKAQALPAEAAP